MMTRPTTVATHTFIAHVEDKPGVLNRIASLFRRRGFNIVSLTVGRTAEPGVSRLTLVIDADEDTARRIEANLYKLVNVLLVEDVTSAPSVARELALIKVRASAETRPRVLQVCEVFGARVIDLTAQLVTVELTATHDKIDDLVGVLAADGVVEMVRTGVVAMARGDRPAFSEPRVAALAAHAHDPRELDSHESQGAA
ncbi:MAG TPA: acetolactate synthase small subunit [Kofleriaceae bacterium]|nr:acetolactate synthase small subunit [Kofleriaceae bacterium]